ncbi:hypothetical protein [Nonomuraea sp. NPDC050691]
MELALGATISKNALSSNLKRLAIADHSNQAGVRHAADVVWLFGIL